MKNFKIYFEMDRCYSSLVIEANSEEEAKESFDMLSADDVMERAAIIPEFEIEDIEEDED